MEEVQDWHGITYDPARRNWKARIHFDGKEQYIGRYSTAYEAALAYDQAARLINETQEISVAARRRTRPLNFPHLRPHDKSLDARLLTILKISPEAAAAVAAGTAVPVTAPANAPKARSSAGGSAQRSAGTKAAGPSRTGGTVQGQQALALAAAAAAAAAAASEEDEDDDGAVEAAAALTAMGSMGTLGSAERRGSHALLEQQHSQQLGATAAAWGGGFQTAASIGGPSGSSRAGTGLPAAAEQQLAGPGSVQEELFPHPAAIAAGNGVAHMAAVPAPPSAAAAKGEDSMVWEAEAAAACAAPAQAAAEPPQQLPQQCAVEAQPEADKQPGDAAGAQAASRPAASLVQPIALFLLRAVFPATPEGARLPAPSSAAASVSDGAAAGGSGPGGDGAAARPAGGSSSSSPVTSVAGSGPQRSWHEARVSSHSGSVDSAAAAAAAPPAAPAVGAAAGPAADGTDEQMLPAAGDIEMQQQEHQQLPEEQQQQQQQQQQALPQTLLDSAPAAGALQSRVHLLLQQLITQCQQQGQQQQPPAQHLQEPQQPQQLRLPVLHLPWLLQQAHAQVMPPAAEQQQQPQPPPAMPSAGAPPPAASGGGGGGPGILSRIGSSELLTVANSCLHEIIDMRLAVLMAPQQGSSLAVMQDHLAAAQRQRQLSWLASPTTGPSASADEVQSALPMPPERIVALSMLRAFLQLMGDAGGAGLDAHAERQYVLGALNQLQQVLSALQRITASASTHPDSNASACLAEWQGTNLGLPPQTAIHPAVERLAHML